MKKLLCLFLVFACVLGLCSCTKTVDNVTTAEILEKNELDNLLKVFDNVQYSYTQYDKDDNVKSVSDYFYKYDNYGYLYFNGMLVSKGVQDVSSLYTVTNGALYCYLAGSTELNVFPNKVRDASDYVKSTIDHFDLDFEDTVKDNGENYLIAAKKITETYYMYIKHDCTYYFNKDNLALEKVEMKATNRDGDLTYRAEIVFSYNIEAPTETADKYFSLPKEEDAVTTVEVVYPQLENSQPQTFTALESTMIRGATVNDVDYTVYKDETLETELTTLSERDEGVNTVYIAPTPEKEETASATSTTN